MPGKQHLRIMFYGAGVIGSLFAAKLAAAGHQVTVLARGRRLQELEEFGIVLRELKSGRLTATRTRLVQALAPDDAYDLIVVPVQRTHLAEILPVLAANKGTPDVLIMVNNPSGYEDLTRTLGQRALVGFPGAGGGRDGHVIQYVLAPSFIQPSTFGEIDGRVTPRLIRLVKALRAAGIPAVISRRMDAWQKTHVAWVSPLANALYMAGGSNYELAKRPEAVRLLIRAVREGFQVLKALGVPITPARLRFWGALPAPVLALILRRVFDTGFAEYIMARHANTARDEMQALAGEFKALADMAGIPTPAVDLLRSYI